jgi:hypothetical protein
MMSMKKAASIVLLATMIITVFVLTIPVTGIAGMNPVPTDITDQIKWSTVYEVYSMKLPVVRLDAVFVHAQDYDMALVSWSSYFVTVYSKDVLVNRRSYSTVCFTTSL